MKSTVFTFALCTIFALSSPPGAASPSSIVGMGVTTGTPSGDIRALRDHASEEFRVVTTDLVRDEDVDALRPVFAERAVRPFRIVVQTDVMADPSAGFLRVTKEFLGKLLGYSSFSIYYLDSQDLATAVKDGLADFVIAEPTFFAAEGPMLSVDVIASLRAGEAPDAEASQGGVIFTRKGATVQKRPPSYIKEETLRGKGYGDLLSLRYERFASTAPESLSGWLAQAGVYAQAGVSREELQLRTSFYGFGADAKVVEAVLNGEADVGFLPACTLEKFEKAGKLNIARDLRIIHAQTVPNFACSLSTPLYPGWTLGATDRTSGVFRRTILDVFRAVKAPGYFDAWVEPAQPRSIFDLFYLLKEGPYSDLADWSFRRILREHGDLIAFLSLVTFLVLTYTVSLSVLVRRKTRELRASLEARELIEAEVSQSRAHIANLERTGLVGQMSTIIAHELKQPLGAIMNYANGLTRRTKRGAMDQEKFLEALGEIVAQAERASRIVERVRGYAKHDYPPRKIADLSLVIDRAIQTFRRSRTTTASLQISVPRNSMAEVDEWEIELALLNLLKNAADAISGVSDPMIRVSLTSREGNWILSVADNGPEVSDEALERFFKPLQTSKGEGGMGLGLSIVANIAERHAGRVTVRKNGRRGVTFDFMLPQVSESTPGATKEETIEVLGRDEEIRALVKNAEQAPNPGVSGPATSEAAVSVIERMTTVDRERRGAVPVTVQSLGLAEAVHFYESGDIGCKEDVRKAYLSNREGGEAMTLVSPYALRREWERRGNGPNDETNAQTSESHETSDEHVPLKK